MKVIYAISKYGHKCYVEKISKNGCPVVVGDKNEYVEAMEDREAKYLVEALNRKWKGNEIKKFYTEEAL